MYIHFDWLSHRGYKETQVGESRHRNLQGELDVFFACPLCSGGESIQILEKKYQHDILQICHWK